MSKREREEGGSVGVVGGGKHSLDSFRNTGTGFSLRQNTEAVLIQMEKTVRKLIR